MADYYVFPTEALLLGECLGEYLEAGGCFIDHVRRRLVPVFPSLVQRREQYGLADLVDRSRKSLLDLILLDLSGSLSSTTLDDQYALHPAFDVIKKWVELRPPWQKPEDATLTHHESSRCSSHVEKMMQARSKC